ncbi:MAG: hypothetical protein R3C58_04930 [Parvularculaceae bacterium]
MKAGDGKTDMLKALRASAESALKRLAPGKPAAAPAPEGFSFRDPTIGFSPGASFDDGAPSGGYSLTTRLDDSAQAIDERITLVFQKASDLAAMSAARAGGEKSLTVWGWRFMIGMAWLLIAFLLDQAGLNARANGLEITPMGVPVSDIAPLARIFFYIGSVAAGIAAIMTASVFLAGNGTNDKLRDEAKRFGDSLAYEARNLSDKVEAHRHRILGDGKAALGEVSQAHLTALEAAHYFRSISFLTTTNPEMAEERFAPFFSGLRQRAPGFTLTDMILVWTLGAFCGLLAGKVLFGVKTAPAVERSALAIMQYPDAARAILVGAGLYALIGIVIDLVADRIGKGVMAKARDEALDAVRSAYLGQGAPLADDMARQVADFVQILQARLGIGGASTGASHAPEAQLAPEPEWRRRDSSVKLVETSFAGAPQPWRTDAYAKKFASEKAPESPAKRGVESLKKPSRD